MLNSQQIAAGHKYLNTYYPDRSSGTAAYAWDVWFAIYDGKPEYPNSEGYAINWRQAENIRSKLHRILDVHR